MPRIFIVPRKGDGKTFATAFQPDLPPDTEWIGYTNGAFFLVATEADLTPNGNEMTAPGAIKAAAAVYGITLRHLNFLPSTASPPIPTTTVLSELLTLARTHPMASVKAVAKKLLPTL